MALLALCGWLGGGCHTPPRPDPNSGASVTVSGRTMLETAHAVSETFQQAGYQVVAQRQNAEFRLVFERPGTGSDTLLYGGWGPDQVWYRVKVRLTGMGGGALLISGDTFRVLYHGEGHFESEHKLSSSGSSRCQELLGQVAARLK